MANQIKCQDCRWFDPQHKFEKGVKKEVKGHGYCGKQSKYPARDQDNQQAPEYAERVAEGELARMVPVTPGGIIPACILAVRRGQ